MTASGRFLEAITTTLESPGRDTRYEGFDAGLRRAQHLLREIKEERRLKRRPARTATGAAGFLEAITS